MHPSEPTSSSIIHTTKVDTDTPALPQPTVSQPINTAYVTQPATIVAMSQHTMVLSTIGVSSCHQCSLRKGCGQRLIIQASACDKSQITLPYEAVQPWHKIRASVEANRSTQAPKSNVDDKAYVKALNVGQQVTLAIPKQTFIQASLWAFLVPIIGLLAFTGLAQMFTQNQATIALLGVLGLSVGIMTMRWRLRRLQDTDAWQPYVVALESEH